MPWPAVSVCWSALRPLLFHELLHLVQRIALGGDSPLSVLPTLPWYWKVVLPALGGALVAPIVYKWAVEAKGHGVPEVMEAVALHGGMMRARVAFAKALASAVTIGTGGSTGREGPVIQIGSALGSTFGQILRLSPERVRTLVGCGAAGGIAATFNAPIAGAFFAPRSHSGEFFHSDLRTDRALLGVSHRRLSGLSRRCTRLCRPGVYPGSLWGSPAVRRTRHADGLGRRGVYLGAV